MRYEIEQDQDAQNPRVDFDNVGTMVCWHRNYDLGDKHTYSDSDDFRFQLAVDADPSVEDRCDYWNNSGYDRLMKNPLIKSHEDACRAAEEHQNKIINKALEDNYIILPLYLYDHSGITMRTGPFGCAFDSGQVGFIYCSKATAIKEWGKKLCTKQVIEKAIKYLEGEVETYDQYLTGDVWCYDIYNDDDEVVDSLCGCWGYDYCEEEAKTALAYCEKEEAEKRRQSEIDAITENEETLS